MIILFVIHEVGRNITILVRTLFGWIRCFGQRKLLTASKFKVPRSSQHIIVPSLDRVENRWYRSTFQDKALQCLLGTELENHASRNQRIRLLNIDKALPPSVYVIAGDGESTDYKLISSLKSFVLLCSIFLLVFSIFDNNRKISSQLRDKEIFRLRKFKTSLSKKKSNHSPQYKTASSLFSKERVHNNSKLDTPSSVSSWSQNNQKPFTITSTQRSLISISTSSEEFTYSFNILPMAMNSSRRSEVIPEMQSGFPNIYDFWNPTENKSAPEGKEDTYTEYTNKNDITASRKSSMNLDSNKSSRILDCHATSSSHSETASIYQNEYQRLSKGSKEVKGLEFGTSAISIAQEISIANYREDQKSTRPETANASRLYYSKTERGKSVNEESILAYLQEKLNHVEPKKQEFMREIAVLAKYEMDEIHHLVKLEVMTLCSIEENWIQKVYILRKLKFISSVQYLGDDVAIDQTLQTYRRFAGINIEKMIWLINSECKIELIMFLREYIFFSNDRIIETTAFLKCLKKVFLAISDSSVPSRFFSETIYLMACSLDLKSFSKTFVVLFDDYFLNENTSTEQRVTLIRCVRYYMKYKIVQIYKELSNNPTSNKYKTIAFQTLHLVSTNVTHMEKHENYWNKDIITELISLYNYVLRKFLETPLVPSAVQCELLDSIMHRLYLSLYSRNEPSMVKPPLLNGLKMQSNSQLT